MNDKILKTVEKYNMLSKGDRVLAAVSGGADSMVMLNFLLSVRDLYELNISVAHIEHGIRGEESLSDALFVENYCNKNNIDFHILHIKATEEAAEASMGVEEYSRKRRYEFFYSLPCDKIATAHNLSDNVETALFRIIRGTGLKGVCGISPVRDKIIRPLIELSSEEIRDYCRKKNIEYRFDSTNSDNKYSRNIIRNQIIPLINTINPSAQKAINNFIYDSTEDYAFIEKEVSKAYSLCFSDNSLDIEKLKNSDNSIAKRVLTEYFKSNNLPLDRKHLLLIMQSLGNPFKIQISGDNYAVSDNKYLTAAILHDNRNNSIDKINDVNFIKEILNINEFNKKAVDFYCDCDKIIGSITVRSRQQGDKINPAGRGCSKTLKKLFNEMKIPIEDRDKIGVVCDDMGIIGIVGYCVDERVKVDSSTVRVFSIVYKANFPSEDDR